MKINHFITSPCIKIRKQRLEVHTGLRDQLDHLLGHLYTFRLQVTANNQPHTIISVLVLHYGYWFTHFRCIDHATPLYRQMLALTSPTSGGRSVGIVRSRNQATELVSFTLTAVRAK
jgi:hypothetical protein